MVNVVDSQARTTVQPVATPQNQAAFLDVPSHVYKGNPHWVPPLRSSEASLFDPENEFLSYGSFQAFVALKGNVPVGRVVAAVNRRLIEKEQRPVGVFGYFECLDDLAIAAALLEAASHWLKQQGITLVRGPIDLSTHNRCLFQIDQFDSSPMIMMPYNPPYYPAFMEQLGWHKAVEAYSYGLVRGQALPPQYERGYNIAVKSGVTFRQLALEGDAFWQDVTQMYYLFNEMFANNWGATARTLEEFKQEAKDLQTLVDPNIFWIAEYQGEMIGFFMALPDYNMVLKHLNGRLNLWGKLKFLWYRRQINQARVLVICAKPEHRRRMVPLALIYLGFSNAEASKRNYQFAELGYVYEDNKTSRSIVEATGAQIHKTYRIYEKAI
ncbi:MAG: hypothetical protein AAF289_05155 [Cyanobacteria bacterium P01_A01_bin.135]